ncbi:MAG: hypothetical protein IANPNBLG_01074 [Bryobacteraceae bacterium]|nr:hypothetical protein [Bryobacteraceae bacterium]
MSPQCRVVRAIGLLAILVVPPLCGQTQGEITGEVTDSSGAVIAGVSITITNEGTNVSRQAITNSSGTYRFPSLLPGIYRLRAEMAGFQSVMRSDVQLQVQQVARIDFRMEVGQVTETLNVPATSLLLMTENATTGTVIENRRIVDLPLDGRNFLQLIALSPNVSYGFGNAGQQVSIQGGQRSTQNISVSGQRSEFNHYTLDGVENTDNNFNSYLFLPSIDALEEFKVQTGIYPAEFGRNTSQINVSTKAGTNSFHGALFEFFRNSKMDANDFGFTSVAPVKNPFVRNQYGFTLAGPVFVPKIYSGKNQLFFMANYEALRDRKGLRQNADLPTIAMREGNFAGIPQVIYDPATRVRSGTTVLAQPFSGNAIPSSRFNGKAVALLKYYPLPNVTGAGLSRNYQALEGRRQDSDQFTIRIDFAQNSKSNWFGRWSWGDELSLTPSTFHDQGFKLDTKVQQGMLSNTRVLTPAIVNEFRFGYNRFLNSNLQAGAYVNNAVGELGGIPGIAPPEPLIWGIPSIGITGFSGFGDSSTAPNLTRTNVFEWIDNISVNAGRHSLRFGVEFRRDQYNQIGNQFPRGSFGFSGQATQNPSAAPNTGFGMADYLLGLVRTSAGSLGLAVAQLRGTRQYYYIDDSWKLHSNLILSIGLRYEFTPPYIHKHNGLINTQVISLFDPTRRPVVVRAGSGDFYESMPFRYAPSVQIARDGRLGRALVQTDYIDFAPRIGLAYSPTSRWTIRSGFGVFFAQDIGNARYDMSRNLAARRNDTSNNDFPNLTLDAPFASLGTVVVASPTILSNQYDRRTPYVIQYLFNTQRQLTKDAVLEVGYTGNQGHKIERWVPVNFPTPGPGDVQSRRPFNELGIIQLLQSAVNSNYHALTAKFQQQFSRGYTALVSYTFSKAIDNGSGIRTHGGDEDFPQDPYNLSASRGLANFNQKQRLVTSILWELPIGKGKRWLNAGVSSFALGGWQLGSIFTYRSGLPYTIQNGVDDANIGWPSQHPNRTTAPLNPPGGKDPQRYFNPAAFVRISPYTFGNVGRDTMIGPELFSWDFSAMKKFPIVEEHELQFRFEAFNIPNRPNFSIPNANLSSSSFARISSTDTTMREIQLSLKYVF